MSGLGNGFVNLFKSWGRGIGNAADNFLLGADARKAISDEVISKFKPMIDRAKRVENKRAANIKDLNDKLNKSKQAFQGAKDKWNQDYNLALTKAKDKRQADIDDYEKKLQEHNKAIADANTNKQDIIDQLSQQEASYNPTKTIYTDVKSGDKYLVDPVTGEYKNITQIYRSASKKKKDKITKYIKYFDERLLDTSSGTPKVINAFDEATRKVYRNKNSIFDNYSNRVEASKRVDLKNANSQIKQAKDDLRTWQSNNHSRPADWDDNADLNTFKSNFKANNAKPTYSFNGQNYSNKAALDKAYQNALDYEKKMQSNAMRRDSRYVSKRDTEIAKRIQDAKDIKKAKLALGGALGAGALYAGAKAIYGGDDTDTTDNTNNIDNTDNTYTDEPDPEFKAQNTPEGKAALNGKSIDTDFDPDKADALATLADAAYDKGVEDGNSIRSSGDLGNNIAATTGGHTMDDRLYELIKNMKDSYKADAVANYIYSRHGDDPEVQYLGWRGWLNKYYGDSLRSMMNINPSSYKGMHVSGGL